MGMISSLSAGGCDGDVGEESSANGCDQPENRREFPLMGVIKPCSLDLLRIIFRHSLNPALNRERFHHRILGRANWRSRLLTISANGCDFDAAYQKFPLTGVIAHRWL